MSDQDQKFVEECQACAKVAVGGQRILLPENLCACAEGKGSDEGALPRAISQVTEGGGAVETI